MTAHQIEALVGSIVDASIIRKGPLRRARLFVSGPAARKLSALPSVEVVIVDGPAVLVRVDEGPPSALDADARGREASRR